MDAKAWEKVDDLIDKNQNKTIKEYFAEDPDRAAKFSLEAAGWFLDYSKNRIDREMMKALVKLAEKSDLKAEIEKMFTGKKINATEGRAVLHTALRNMDSKAKIKVDGKDVMPGVRKVLAAMGDFSDTIRNNLKYSNLEASDEDMENAAKMGRFKGFFLFIIQPDPTCRLPIHTYSKIR